MTSLPTAPEPVPFYISENGAVRLHGSRMPLEGVVELYKNGLSAEDIHRDFNAPLAEVHGAIAYYLRHKEEVEAYVNEVKRSSEALRREAESQPEYQETIRRIKARWAERQANGTSPR